MYDAILPPIFCFIYSAGTVIGKAAFGNYVAVFHNVTIGANKGVYPTLANRVTLCSGSPIIGGANIESYVMMRL